MATRELWRVLLDMDWKATLKAYLLPIDHPLVHQLTYPRRMQLRVGDGLWVRLVDVGAALSARAYADDGARRARASTTRSCPRTPAAGGSRGRTAERTDDEPDLALGVGELGSAYLGGFGFGELVRAGVVRELKEGEPPARTRSSGRARRSRGAPRSSELGRRVRRR